MLYLITRHTGAINWLLDALEQHKELAAHTAEIQLLSHIDSGHVFAQGDMVVGILPINKVHEVVQQGARYFHLSLELPFALRGQELSAEQMQKCSPTIEEYKVSKINIA